jgi:hypothetical protein
LSGLLQGLLRWPPATPESVFTLFLPLKNRHLDRGTLEKSNERTSIWNMRARRRFPPPRSVEETAAAFVVKDHGGQPLAYIYFEEEPGR